MLVLSYGRLNFAQLVSALMKPDDYAFIIELAHANDGANSAIPCCGLIFSVSRIINQVLDSFVNFVICAQLLGIELDNL